MKPRNSCRLQVEQLEHRAVPAVVGGHLVGHNVINTTFMAQLTGVNFLTGTPTNGSGQITIQGSIGSGLLKGTVSFSGGIVPSMSSTVIDFAGTLNITTKHGTVFTTDTGFVDISNPSAPMFTDKGTITGGTKEFKGVTGSFTATGTVNIIGQSVSGPLTGTINGASPHHKHHK